MTWRTPERVRRPSGEEAGRAWPRVRTGERGLAGPRDAEPIGGRIRGGSAGEACTENIGRTLSVCPMMAALATMVMGANCPWCRQAQRQAPDSQQSGSDVPSSVDTDTSEEVCRPEIGRAHVRTPVTNAHIVCRILLDKKTNIDAIAT